MNKGIHICRAVQKECYATLWSYGEICVGCGCCSKDLKVRRKARLKYHQEMLKEKKSFKYDDDTEISKIQKKNNASWIQWHEKRIKKLKESHEQA